MAKVQHGFRQVHLDFHTSPHIPDVAANFDAKEFARIVKAAHVDSVTVFAKCHHGHLYFNTEHPARHPTLPKELDLLRAQIDALHAEGIRAPIYISVLWDEFAANMHPEWLVVNPDGTPRGAGPLQPGWRTLDMASPYYDYLSEQVAQVLKRFSPVDGVFFDICFDVPSVSKWAKARMGEWKLDPADPRDRDKYASRLSSWYMERLFKQVKAASPDATVFFNSRPLRRLPEDVKFLTHIEIESLPTGGWGYWHFPINVRYARTFDLPYLGMTARFHKSWADFGGFKALPALKYEVCRMLAHGARCSIGDQMHPRGVLDEAAWNLIAQVYGYVESCQPWCDDAVPLTEIGVFREPTDAPAFGIPAEQSDLGAVRILTQLKHQFDVVTADSHFERYQLLILPDLIPVEKSLAKKLSRYLKNGGRLLFTGTSGLSEKLKPVLPELPVQKVEPPAYSVTYMRFDPKLFPDVPATDHVNYVPTYCATPKKGAVVPVRVVEPYFERTYRHFCSHAQTPPNDVSKWPAALVTERVAYVPFPVFSAYAQHASRFYRRLVDAVIRLLIGRPMLEIQAPSFVECSVMQKGKATVLHVLAWTPERRTEHLDVIEDEVHLFDLRASLALGKAPGRVTLAPSGQSLRFSFANGRVNFTIPEVRGHQMVVFE